MKIDKEKRKESRDNLKEKFKELSSEIPEFKKSLTTAQKNKLLLKEISKKKKKKRVLWIMMN